MKGLSKKAKEVQKTSAAAEPETTTYAAEFRSFLHRNAPADFEQKFDKAKPFIIGSFVSWPLFWMYKGMEWSQKRDVGKLSTFIHRAYFQAKILQLAIFSVGILAATYVPNEKIQNLSNFFHEDPRDI